MIRHLAAMAAGAIVAFGQGSAPPARTLPWVVDLVAVDAEGRAVTDLTAADFELKQGGSAAKVTGLSWFDTRGRTVVTRGGTAPGLDLLPEEIHRTLVAVVDDLGLTAQGVEAVRGALWEYVAKSMAPGERMATLCSSGGMDAAQQLTGDSRVLEQAIASIHFWGGGVSAAGAGRATWQTVRLAVGGLQDAPGRKLVVVFTGNPGEVVPPERGLDEVLRTAAAGGVTVYVAGVPGLPSSASAVPAAMERFVRGTGGAAGLDFGKVLEREQGYYAIAIEPNDHQLDSAGGRLPAPLRAKVNRPGVTLRWREGYLGWPARGEFPLLVDETAPLDRAMQSPFAANPVGIRMTVLPMENGLLGPTVHVLVRVNQRDLPAIHDLAGRCRTAMRLRLAAWRDDGLAVQPLERELPIEIDEAEYASRADAGFGLAFLVRLPGPGVWQFRAVVADGLGARTGGDTRFVQVPKPRQGWLSLSGLILYRGESQKTISPEVLLGDPAVRLFEQGDAVTFKYEVLDPVLGSGGDSTVETRARLFAGGREVLDTGNAEVSFGPAHLDAHRTVAGRLQLNRTLAKGVYVLQVAVRDLKAPAGDSRTAMQTIDFEVRE